VNRYPPRHSADSPYPRSSPGRDAAADPASAARPPASVRGWPQRPQWAMMKAAIAPASANGRTRNLQARSRADRSQPQRWSGRSGRASACRGQGRYHFQLVVPERLEPLDQQRSTGLMLWSRNFRDFGSSPSRNSCIRVPAGKRQASLPLLRRTVAKGSPLPGWSRSIEAWV